MHPSFPTVFSLSCIWGLGCDRNPHPEFGRGFPSPSQNQVVIAEKKNDSSARTVDEKERITAIWVPDHPEQGNSLTLDSQVIPYNEFPDLYRSLVKTGKIQKVHVTFGKNGCEELEKLIFGLADQYDVEITMFQCTSQGVVEWPRGGMTFSNGEPSLLAPRP